MRLSNLLEASPRDNRNRGGYVDAYSILRCGLSYTRSTLQNLNSHCKEVAWNIKHTPDVKLHVYSLLWGEEWWTHSQFSVQISTSLSQWAAGWRCVRQVPGSQIWPHTRHLGLSEDELEVLTSCHWAKRWEVDQQHLREQYVHMLWLYSAQNTWLQNNIAWLVIRIYI